MGTSLHLIKNCFQNRKCGHDIRRVDYPRQTSFARVASSLASAPEKTGSASRRIGIEDDCKAALAACPKALSDDVAPVRKVFVVGYAWGAFVFSHLCLFWPNKVRALVNLSVVFTQRNQVGKPVEQMWHVYGDKHNTSIIQGQR
uniref:Uncharacterized protein n=1 Tax=Kalanchoe fedtschenkoi TaxID=63787 RepID=A0A7N1A6P5_KALFE